MDLLSEISSKDPIPEATLAYLEQRAINSFYAFILGKFLDAQKQKNLKQSELARRINRGSDVVNRWLRSPSNWQIGTAARLLVGIAGEEAILSSAPWVGRKPQNQSVLSLLDDDEVEPIPQPPTTTTKSNTIILQVI
jgi:hypothetical protein